MLRINKPKLTVCSIMLMMLSGAPAYADHDEIYGSLDLNKGKELYNTTCVACHGPDGKNVIPGVPNFKTSDSRLTEKGHATLIQNMSEGYQSPGSIMAMPPKGGNPSLSEQDLANILEYMLQTFASR